jgi:hypothetical protein
MAGHYVHLCSSEDLGKVTKAFEEAIALSFTTNPMREPTATEVRRRFGLCDKIFTVLRADLKWSLPKIIDALPTYLKCELDGVPYDPEQIGSSWSPAAVDAAHDVPRTPQVPLLTPQNGTEAND